MRGSTSSLFHAARTLLLLLILFQLSTYNPSTATKTLHRKRYSQYIKTSCNATIYRRLCYRSLSIFATRIKTSPRLLADTALCVSLSSARKVSKFVLKVSKKKGLKPREAAAIVDCVELVGDTIDNLQKSVREMGLTGRKGRNFELLMNDIQTWVSAALTDEDTCMDGFGGRSMNGTIKTAPYIHLARTFDLVEAEKGKIKATSMLCNMFRSLLALSPEDVLPAVYLCTNKIASDHENMELNIGGSLVTAALEEACGANRSKIRELYNNLGDLGDVAQLCRQTQKLLVPPSPLLIKDVFSVLRKISVQTGSGSTLRKKSLVVNLMRSCREKEIKFIVRTLVRNLRIGAMMRTVLPALAQAVVMNSPSKIDPEGTTVNLKEKLQCISTAVVEAYNVLPSLDLLVPSLMNKGIGFFSSTLSMVPGIPLKPMLAKITNGIPQALKLFQNKAFTCEYKYDGQRAQIHKLVDGSVRVFSRNGDETTSRFPDLVNIIKESWKTAVSTFILDAEVVAVDRKNGCKLMSFQELSSRERGSKDSSIAVDSIKVDICIFVFDIMFANGEQLLSFPLRQRRKYLKDMFNEKLGYFEYAKETTIEVDDALLSSESTLSRINSFLEDAFNSSCEGIMVKSLDVDAGYSPSKRTDTWLKVKRDYVEGLNDSLDLVPIGAWHGNGRKAGWYSPFLMACYNPDTEEFQSVCRVMSGFSDSFYTEMKEFYSGDKILSRKPPYYKTAEVPDLWFASELVWQIRGADFTVSPVHQAAVGLVHPSRGISVRFPRFIRTVSDRNPEECSTASDIAEMFRLQTRKMDVNV